MFAGNKCDLARQDRKVPKEVVSNYVHYELPRLRAKVSALGLQLFNDSITLVWRRKLEQASEFKY